ncbi:putative oxidoreductase [Saccharicrinis carchari]|uniref:Putative oxidoreductase n=1 Tax=Saccharicrinis carchari TaxID=1168039 RepID=A0A521ASP6_SACCC|nr:DoxX family protein [Saccharicrinis carchari]SMO37853.1 putative oxidoreductase [Saccharicrinis carchari]
MKEITKSIFNPGYYATHINIALLILRLVVGVFMLTHGVGKLQTLFSSESIQFPDPIGVGATASLALAVFSEVICSIFIIIGLGTRFAAIPLFITMVVAAFVIHINDGFGKQEFALLYAVIYITIAIIGAGKYSFDYLMFIPKKK